MDELLRKEIIDKYHRVYRRRPMPLCNDCFTSKNVIPCVYGIPNKELGTYAKAGHIKLMGIDFSTLNGQIRMAYCSKCEKYVYDYWSKN